MKTYNNNFKIAVPTSGSNVDNHFGHCEFYTVFEIDENKKIIDELYLPAGEGCGCKSNISTILKNIGVRVMLAGNMGDGAKNVLELSEIEVVRGCSGDVKLLIENYLEGRINDSGMGCDTHEHNGCEH